VAEPRSAYAAQAETSHDFVLQVLNIRGEWANYTSHPDEAAGQADLTEHRVLYEDTIQWRLVKRRVEIEVLLDNGDSGESR
jgi:hypothetical protein